MSGLKAKYRTALICLGLALAVFAVFGQVRHFQFINYDDQEYVFENPAVQSGLNWQSIRWAFTESYASNWHPLTWLSHMLDWQIYGNQAGGHHATNLLFHVLNTLLLFLLCRRLTGAVWRSVIIAALFGLHPLHVESVAWVSERKDVLSTFFGLLALMLYHRYAFSARPRHKILFYILTSIFYLLSLLSKPMLVTLPFLLLLLDFWPLRRMTSSDRIPLLRLVLEKIPFFALTLASCVITFVVQRDSGAVRSLEDISFDQRILNALTAYGFYLRKMVWPVDLAIFYPHPRSVPVFEAIISGMMLAAITWVVVKQIKPRPYLAVGWFWFLGTLVPVLGLVQVGVLAAADRYTYIPFIGLFIALVWGIFQALQNRSWRKLVLVPLPLAVLLGCAVLAFHQVSYWQNSKTLFSHALQVTTGNYVAHHSLGTVLANENKPEEAEHHFRQAIACYSRFPESHHNLGNILANRNQIDEALQRYNEAIRLRPHYPEAHNSLGLLFAKQKKWPEAAECFAKAIAQGHHRGLTYFNLAETYSVMGKTEDALASYEQALQLDPALPEAHFRLGMLLAGKRQMEPAFAHLQEAINLRPGWSLPLSQLAWIWASDPDPKHRNGRGAVEMAETAAQLTQHKDARVLSILAASYAEAGRFPDAIRTAEIAKTLAESAGETANAQSVEMKLQLYRRNQPFHLPVDSAKN